MAKDAKNRTSPTELFLKSKKIIHGLTFKSESPKVKIRASSFSSFQRRLSLQFTIPNSAPAQIFRKSQLSSELVNPSQLMEYINFKANCLIKSFSQVGTKLCMMYQSYFILLLVLFYCIYCSCFIIIWICFHCFDDFFIQKHGS